MHPSPDGRTLFVPKPQRASIVERATTGFPPDLLNRLAARLQILTWLYAFTLPKTANTGRARLAISSSDSTQSSSRNPGLTHARENGGTCISHGNRSERDGGLPVERNLNG